jgi:hypothetical protein
MKVIFYQQDLPLNEITEHFLYPIMSGILKHPTIKLQNASRSKSILCSFKLPGFVVNKTGWLKVSIKCKRKI